MIANRESEKEFESLLELPQVCQTFRGALYRRDNYSQKYGQKSLEMFIYSYHAYNPIYQCIKMSNQEVNDIIGGCFFDEKYFTHSQVYLKYESDDLLACRIQQDFSHLEKKEARVYHSNPKLKLKQKLENSLVDHLLGILQYDKTIKRITDENEELLGNIQYGEISYIRRGCTQKSNQGLGLGYILLKDGLEAAYNQGYKYAFAIIHNPFYDRIGIKLQGQILRRLDISQELDDDGVQVFKDNVYGLGLIIFDFRRKNIRKILSQSNDYPLQAKL